MLFCISFPDVIFFLSRFIMSYYSGRSSYSSGLTSGYSGYSSSSYRPSYDYSTSSYDSYSWRNYKPRNYDFGTSSFLSKDYGSRDLYSRKYDEYSWRAKDLMSDNPTRESLKDKYVSKSVNESEDKDELVELKDNKSKEELKDSNENSSSKDNALEDKYSRKNYSRDELSRKDYTREDSSDLSKGSARKDYTREYDFSKEDNSRDKYSNGDNTREDSRYLTDYSRDYTKKDYGNDINGDYSFRGSKTKASDDYLEKNDDKNIKLDSNGLDLNTNVLQDNKRSSKRDGRSEDLELSIKNLSLYDGKDKKEGAAKKVYNFNDDDDDEVFIKPESEKSLQSGKESIFDNTTRPWSTKDRETINYNQPRNEAPRNIPTDRYSSFKPAENGSANHNTGYNPANQKLRGEHPKSKSASDVTDSGPLRMHRQGVAKFISAIPDENRYVSSVNFLPDSIELRFIGAPPMEKKMKRCRSITDLYEIEVRPDDQEQETKRKHPWEETIRCEKQDVAYAAYDSENEILHYTKHRHEHTKEMYISQHTHYFDPDEPRTHIAGWKCDVEPNGIPHNRSRMCVMKSPVISESRRHVPRPKSAPPQLYKRPVSPEEIIVSQKVDVFERGNYTLPRTKGKDIHQDFYQTSVDESMTEEVSSLGYAPSDDTSDSSAFFFSDHHRYYNDNHDKDANLSYSKPKLIRISAEFPGIRNLEKIRRKRQSMGSYSSEGSRSSVGHSSSPRNGEYGFFVALTSGDPRKPNNKRQQRHSHYN